MQESQRYGNAARRATQGPPHGRLPPDDAGGIVDSDAEHEVRVEEDTSQDDPREGREPLRARWLRVVSGYLRNSIDSHGPITRAWIGSASKRVVAGLMGELRARMNTAEMAAIGDRVIVAESPLDANYLVLIFDGKTFVLVSRHTDEYEAYAAKHIFQKTIADVAQKVKDRAISDVLRRLETEVSDGASVGRDENP